jgi:hypothetical protein
MRKVFYGSLLILLCACKSGSIPMPAPPPDQVLFYQGLNELDGRKNGLPPAFDALQKEYPDSPYALHVRSIGLILERMHGQQQVINQLTRERIAWRDEKKDLQQTIDALENDRRRLRQLLIDLEKRRQ